MGAQLGKSLRISLTRKSTWVGCDVIANEILKRNVSIDASPASQGYTMTIFPGF